MCNEPKFWVFKLVTDGPPPVPCLYRMKEEYDRTVGPIGIVIVVVAVAVFFSFVCHYGFYLIKEKQVRGIKKFIND